VFALDLLTLLLIPLDLLPLDIPTNGAREGTPVGTIALLGVVLLALVVMVSVLVLLRRRQGRK
jgi:hypothetical protein